MSFASLRRHALITTAALATAVVVPLAGIAFVAPAARATDTTTTTSSVPTSTTTAPSTTAPTLTAAQQLAAKKHAAWKKKRAQRLAARQARARRAAHRHAVHRAALLHKQRIERKRGAHIVAVAALYKGRPYRYGASGPRAFDCSGYTSYVVRKAVHVNLPRTAAQQAHAARVDKVSRARRMVGDLVFFHGGGGIYHVAIYAGNGRIWTAPHTGSHVRLQAIYSSNVTYGRIV